MEGPAKAASWFVTTSEYRHIFHEPYRCCSEFNQPSHQPWAIAGLSSCVPSRIQTRKHRIFGSASCSVLDQLTLLVVSPKPANAHKESNQNLSLSLSISCNLMYIIIDI